jgi:transposase-like protein
MGDLTVLNTHTQVQTRKTGRPTLYTEEKARAICDHLEKGLTKRAACALVDVNEETFRWWCDTREIFLQMVARAEAKAEEMFTEVLVKAVGGTQGQADYRAGVEWLKRRRRADYGDTIDVRKLDDETILRMLHASQQDVTEDGRPAIVSGADDI